MPQSQGWPGSPFHPSSVPFPALGSSEEVPIKYFSVYAAIAPNCCLHCVPSGFEHGWGKFVLALKGCRLLMIRENFSELQVRKAMPLFLISRVNFSFLWLLQFNNVGQPRAGREAAGWMMAQLQRWRRQRRLLGPSGHCAGTVVRDKARWDDA